MCPTNQASALPAGEWTHSHEEDQAGVLVYRRTESFPFPPTRGGRDSLRVDSSGQITALAPGPDDRPRPTGIRVLAGGTAETAAPDSSIEIIESTDNVLKIRRR
ncbi:hypothetical protein GY21_16830 [Cryobacterium roopkundense]|uniref:Uncharacterized protein n=1 Tax=Cryobacterium roopkundense TaxID=1001240 RepID=A0A099J1V5_9MICO|nr:hypothetical protein [Cryobacterium roopkundense]KGJ72221.1 hypothetical protein GY21_16830 [Cryobacterium roopkundense]MBB5642843.1 hypothetical protein [Cryobacterium roopkundense]